MNRPVPLGPLSGLARRRDGSVLIEFAFGAAVLVLLLGTVELARYILLQQKLERVAMTVADLNARGEELTRAEVLAVFDAVPHLIAPFRMGEAGLVIVTSVGDTGTGRATVLWQERGGGTAQGDSRVGLVGDEATLPDGFVIRRDETAIVAEAFLRYDALFLDPLIASGTMYARAMQRPRLMDTTRLN